MLYTNSGTLLDMHRAKLAIEHCTVHLYAFGLITTLATGPFGMYKAPNLESPKSSLHEKVWARLGPS